MPLGNWGSGIKPTRYRGLSTNRNWGILSCGRVSQIIFVFSDGKRQPARFSLHKTAIKLSGNPKLE